MCYHRLINAFDLQHTYYNYNDHSSCLSRNIKYLASCQQGFSCDKALSEKKKNITLINPLYSGNPE